MKLTNKISNFSLYSKSPIPLATCHPIDVHFSFN